MNGPAYLFIAGFVLAGLASVLLTPFVIRLAHHVGMIDEVDERRMHEVPKPRIGGVAVFFGFAFALFAVLGVALTHVHGFFPIDPHESSVDQLHDQLGCRAQFSRSHLRQHVDFGRRSMGRHHGHAAAPESSRHRSSLPLFQWSMGFTSGSSTIRSRIDVDDYIYFPWWVSYPLTLLWYVGMMNAINFIDGLDGLLTGFSAISCLFLFAIALTKGDPVVAMVMVALAGAALGFLPYNFNPARIILGDTGSLFIGYVFATVSIIGASKTAIAVGLLAPLVVLALPILDTAAAIYRRARSGKRITEADRGHFHHQLIFRYGLNVRQAVLLIYAICIVLGAVALFLAGGFHVLGRAA